MRREPSGAAAPDGGSSGRTWRIALVPLLLLAGLVGLIVWFGPAGSLLRQNYPPVERLSVQRVTLQPDWIFASVLNDGPDAVTIAQVQVDEAYWRFTADPGNVLGHLERATLRIPYPWVRGEAHVLRIVTSTGLTFDHAIAVAVPSPRPDLRHFGVFTLIGIYVGVIPVAIGLLWFPLVSRLKQRALDFLLALTVGLLVFLLADATHEGLDAAAAVPESLQGSALFLVGALSAFLGLETLQRWLRGRRRDAAVLESDGWVLSFLIAVGIGLHNFGEGLAIGAAFAVGEAALGTLLIVGFVLHNTTEGLAIVVPLARERPKAGRLVRLGLVGGAPTIAGAWIGGFVYSPVWSVLFLAIGVGAIAQVAVQIGRQMAGSEPLAGYFSKAHVLGGLLSGFSIMYLTGLLVG